MIIWEQIKQYRGEANFAISNIVTSCVSMATGIIAAAFISPEDLGVIQTVLLFFTYASFLHMGVFNGLNRNLAYYKARGDLETMQDEINTSYTVSYIVSLLSGLLGVGVLVYYLIKGSGTIYLISCILLIANLVLTPLITNIEATYKSGQEFSRLGNKKNVQSIIYLTFSFLPAVIGALGRVIAGVLNLVSGYVLRLINPPYVRKGKGSLRALKDLVSTGFPILLSGYIWGIINVMDKTFIAFSMTPMEVGLYTVAGYCITLFMMIPSSISAFLYPKAAATYGATGRKDALLGFWWKSMSLMAAIIIPLIVIAYFLLPTVVNLVMPKYSGGITAARISLLTCATFIYFGPSALFGTFKKNKLYICVQLLILALFWLIVLLFKDLFTTIESVAWLKFVLSSVQLVFVVFYSRYLLSH